MSCNKIVLKRNNKKYLDNTSLTLYDLLRVFVYTRAHQHIGRPLRYIGGAFLFSVLFRQKNLCSETVHRYMQLTNILSAQDAGAMEPTTIIPLNSLKKSPVYYPSYVLNPEEAQQFVPHV